MTDCDRIPSVGGAPDRQLVAVSRVLARHIADPRRLRMQRRVVGALGKVPSSGVERRPLAGSGAVRIVRPPGAAESPGVRPGLLWIHGGGYVLGTARQDDRVCRRFARETGRVVVSVDYRLAPEHPYPAALEDCREALAVLRSLPEVDGADVVVAGMSAGGGLAAQLSHDLVRRGEQLPVLQALFYPMLDPGVRSAADEPDGLRVWDAASNRFGWDSYLSGGDGFVPVIEAISPTIPRTWIGVGTTDLFHAESLRYADALRRHGVHVDVTVVEGGFHGFDVLAPWTRSAREFTRSALRAVRSAGAPSARG